MTITTEHIIIKAKAMPSFQMKQFRPPSIKKKKASREITLLALEKQHAARREAVPW